VTPAARTAPALPESDIAAIEQEIAALRTGARVWSHLTLRQRIALLESVRESVGAVADEWVEAASVSKGLAPDSELRGEEWMSGPYAVLGALDGYLRTLRTLTRGGSPLDGVRIDSVAADGAATADADEAQGERIRAHVFPATGSDRLLLSGFRGEIWFRPGVTAADAVRRAGLGQLHPGSDAGVGLVLGAGNVSSIPILDVLYELLADNRVSLLKVNPMQDTLVPVFDRALAPLIGPGFVRVVRGGGDVGAYLTASSAFAHVHITGSAATFDAIVWGTGGAATRRRREERPKLKTPITAELGGVSPIIVVPGRWSDADLRYQAEHIVTMRLHNSGHNCIAGQVVLLSAEWPQREEFLRALHDAYSAAPARPVWYPRSDEKLDRADADYPAAARCGDGSRRLIELAGGEDAGALETTEYFTPVLGVVELPGLGQEFLDAAVDHANERLTGTLGANILIDPEAEAALGDGLERAVARLRYGGIAINAWTGVIFATPVLSWGGFPGSTLADVGSGIGVVHNTSLLADVERSVLRGPFRPFPRAVTGGRFTVLAKPPWFVTSRTAKAVGTGLTRYLIDRNPLGLVATLTKAMGA
jgi:acyl-CoA reductase-like NAD-dependent aldehyde dehydrogenase